MNLGQDQNYIHPTAHLIQFQNSDVKCLVFQSQIPVVPPSTITQLYPYCDLIYNIKLGLIKGDAGAMKVAKDLVHFANLDRQLQIDMLKRSYSREF